MYRLLLVDDEPEIREGLQEVVNFSALGFTVVGEAGNGLEALHLAEELSPDLIITDIRMPLMNGLTMAAEVRARMPSVQFIILSGYDEFDYARQAIEITALRYVLKPISSEEFIAMMQDVKLRLDEEHARRRDLINLRTHFRASLPLLREMLLSSLLTGTVAASTALETAARYEMPLQSPAYALAMLLLPGRMEDTAGATIEDPELLACAIANIAEEVVGQRLAGYLFHHNGALALLLLLPSGDYQAMSAVVDALETVRQHVEHYLHHTIHIGISAPWDSLEALAANGERQALSALNRAIAQGDGQVLCITDVVPDSGQAPAMDEYALRMLGNHLKSGDEAQALAALRDLLAQELFRSASVQEYRAGLLEVLMVFIRTARDLGLTDMEDALQDALEQAMRYPALPQIQPMLERLCTRFMRTMQDNKATTSRALAQQAVDYLHAHYMEEALSINTLCAHLHISTSYFSALFKKETRQTFVQYLTKLRMDEAMSLLVSSGLRTSEIAERVGISDPSYFSYTFKRHFGYSPSHVRKGREVPS